QRASRAATSESSWVFPATGSASKTIGMRTLYTAVSTAHGGRDGHVRSSDGIVDLDLKTPKEMGGPGGAGTNPEQLFASGYAACFESALRLVARMQKKTLNDAHITAHVKLKHT